MARKFAWDSWDYDCDGNAYIIAKDQCPNKEDVPDFICQLDDLDPACKANMVVREGWCGYQCRTDWEDGDGQPFGGYAVEEGSKPPLCRRNGKRRPGWFPVWIVRETW